MLSTVTLISGVLLLIVITIISSVFLCIASIIYFPQLLRNKIMKFAGKLTELEKKNHSEQTNPDPEGHI